VKKKDKKVHNQLHIEKQQEINCFVLNVQVGRIQETFGWIDGFVAF
jgi:hypothetical protein